MIKKRSLGVWVALFIGLTVGGHPSSAGRSPLTERLLNLAKLAEIPKVYLPDGGFTTDRTGRSYSIPTWVYSNLESDLYNRTRAGKDAVQSQRSHVAEFLVGELIEIAGSLDPNDGRRDVLELIKTRLRGATKCNGALSNQLEILHEAAQSLRTVAWKF